MKYEAGGFLFTEALRTFRKWPYYGILLLFSAMFGSIMMLVMLDLYSRELDVMDAQFVQPEKIIRYAWRDSAYDSAFDTLESSSIVVKSLFYTRDEWVMSTSEARALRVAHVDDAYLELTGQTLAKDEVALDAAYLSVFSVQEGDYLTIDGATYRVAVHNGLLDVEQQALILRNDTDRIWGIPSMQCVLKVSEGKTREAVRQEIESALHASVLFGNVQEIPNGALCCLYPDEVNSAALKKQRSNLLNCSLAALLIFLYVTLQTTNTARCFVARTAREWAMMRLLCGLRRCRVYFFLWTMIVATTGTFLSWLLLPLLFQAIGSGFYVPQGSVVTLLGILPLLLLLGTVMTRTALTKGNLAQQLKGDV